MYLIFRSLICDILYIIDLIFLSVFDTINDQLILTLIKPSPIVDVLWKELVILASPITKCNLSVLSYLTMRWDPCLHEKHAAKFV